MAVKARPDGGRFDVKRSKNFELEQSIPDRNQDKSTSDMIQITRGEKIETSQACAENGYSK